VSARASDKVGGPQRRWDIDWLRISAVLLLFAFHTARIFDNSADFYVKSAQLGTGASYLVAYLGPWGMPLFFVLAGASTWFALRVRSAGRYVKERATRLLVPFFFGVLVLVPPQSYLGLRSHSDYAGTFLEWYPHFFQLIPKDMEGYYLGGHTWGHLWFIIHLFVYSLVALPLFLYLSGESGQRLTRRLAAFFSRRGMILLAGIPLIFAAPFPEIVGGNPLRYIIVFIYGYILMADARFEEAIDRHKVVALILGPGVHLVVAYFDATGRPSGIPAGFMPIVRGYISGFIPWFFLIALLGYGKEFLNLPSRVLSYLGEASYPFYILHQTVIVIFGFYVVQWQTGMPAKFLTILVASLVATALTYDVLVKRTNVTRFLFGMRLKKTVPVPSA
jgi:glucan biosynthesis protein C